MTTLMAVSTASGLVGRCDARCYLALHPDCECICGGRNHGKGRRQAMDNSRQLATRWIEEYAHKQGLHEFTSTIHPECVQATLWSEGSVP